MDINRRWWVNFIPALTEVAEEETDDGQFILWPCIFARCQRELGAK